MTKRCRDCLRGDHESTSRERSRGLAMGLIGPGWEYGFVSLDLKRERRDSWAAFWGGEQEEVREALPPAFVLGKKEVWGRLSGNEDVMSYIDPLIL